MPDAATMRKRREGNPEASATSRSRNAITRGLTKAGGSAGGRSCGNGVATRHSVRDGAGVRFREEEVLADRFRVVRFLGRGGKGEVYETLDLELDERVALKTLRLGHEEAARAIERFRREILLARRVTHPNVCPDLSATNRRGRASCSC